MDKKTVEEINEKYRKEIANIKSRLHNGDKYSPPPRKSHSYRTKQYNGPQSHLMDILMEKVEGHGPIDTVSQVYLARACLSIEKKYLLVRKEYWAILKNCRSEMDTDSRYPQTCPSISIEDINRIRTKAQRLEQRKLRNASTDG